MKLNTLFEGFSKQIYSNSNESSDDDSALSAASTNNIARIENKKYRLLLDDSIQWEGHTLYRIQYKVDIYDKNNFIIVTKDSLGGYIESLDNLSEKGKCIIMQDAKVYDNAKVYGDAWVYGDAEVWGNAKVYGDARVHGDARIYGNAEVFGNAWVIGILFDDKINSGVCK